MKKLLFIFLIINIALAVEEEETKTNPLDKIKEEIEKKAKEISEKAKEIAENAAEKAKEAGQEISEKTKELMENASEKGKEFKKNFIKLYEKLSIDIQEGIVWLIENGYWDLIVDFAETVGQVAAIQACKTYFPQGAVLCDPIVKFIFDAIVSLLDKIKEDVQE